MNPAAIIREAKADGVRLALSPAGTIKATGDRAAVNGWLAAIREHKAEIIDALKVGAGDTATASRWFLHSADREPIVVSFSPAVTHDEAMACYPDAVAGEPGDLHTVRKSASLAAEEEAAIRAWLAAICEDDQATIAAVIEECRTDAEARRYFTGRAAAELPKPDPLPDDRRTCDQCANLIARRCQAAKRGEIVASRNYEPIRDLPRRCEGYAPGADDPNRRPGRERWPGLIQKGSDDANH